MIRVVGNQSRKASPFRGYWVSGLPVPQITVFTCRWKYRHSEVNKCPQDHVVISGAGARPQLPFYALQVHLFPLLSLVASTLREAFSGRGPHEWGLGNGVRVPARRFSARHVAPSSRPVSLPQPSPHWHPSSMPANLLNLPGPSQMLPPPRSLPWSPQQFESPLFTISHSFCF